MKVKNFFDLQRFGKDGGSTTVTTRDPTPDEQRITKTQADIAEAYSPNAMRLNDIAWNLLNNSVGAVQQDFNALKNQALGQIDYSVQGLKDILTENKQGQQDTLGTLTGVSKNMSNNAGNLQEHFETDRNNIIGYQNNLSNQLPAELGVNTLNIAQRQSELNNLANGTLPTNFTQNMTDAIKKSMTDTIGATMNDLANRGVLNSSVTNQALDDIENNVADSLANHYLQNIGTVQNIVGDRSNLDQQRYANSTDTYNTLYNSMLNGVNARANSTQSIYDLISGTNNNLANWSNQALSNLMNTNAQNANILSNVGIQMANAPITTAAAAQEAAQNPALNLWNASIGLTGSNNGTLAALAGSNQNSTTTTSGGGGLLSGLFGGLF